MKFFGEKPTSATTEDFFGIFAAFIMNFTVSDSIMYRSVFEQYCMKLLRERFSIECRKSRTISQQPIRGKSQLELRVKTAKRFKRGKTRATKLCLAF